MTLFKNCIRCKKAIKPEEKVSRWETYEKGKLTEQVDWHFKCFLKWKDESIFNKAMEAYNKTIKEMLPKAREMIDNARIGNKNSFEE